MSQKSLVEKELAYRELSRRRIQYFVTYCYPKYILTPFHESYLKIIQQFVFGDLNKLMLSVPPQHGKSLISTVYLIPFLFGINPSLKIALMCYSTEKARRFGRQIKRVMNSQEYKNIFPKIKLPDMSDKNFTNSADIIDIPNPEGETGNLFLVGRGAGLTGEAVDIFIMDDLYKNAMEAYSPVIRQSVIDMYDMVAESRLHNTSKQLIVFTRWHEMDLIGYLEKNDNVHRLDSWAQIEKPNPTIWYKVNFEALKTGASTEIDTRKIGEPLFPHRHSQQKLEATRDRLCQSEPEKWAGLYQGNPRPITGLLYGEGFKNYIEIPEPYSLRCVIDVADTGKDRLCAIVFADPVDGYLYPVDIYYSSEPAPVTEVAVCDMLCRLNCYDIDIESNAGGIAYSRNIERTKKERGRGVNVSPFHQSANKEARILTNASEVKRCILFPRGWVTKWPVFAEDVLSFRTLFKANDFDDGPDTLTLMIERSELGEEEEVFLTPV
jgi:predicted phage terminase large subunit-like protein